MAWDLDRVAARIQHHPSRVGLPRRLVAQLSAFEDLEVVADPQPDGPTDSWRSHRRCLESMSAGATHLLVLQDDAVVMHGFAQKMAHAIAQQPDAVLCAFTPGFAYLQRAFEQAKKERRSFHPLQVGAFTPLVAVSYPAAFVEGLLDWADHRANPRQRRQLRGADDGVVALYCRTAKIQPLLMVPSIVEHDAEVSSVGKLHRRVGPHRRAALLDSSAAGE